MRILYVSNGNNVYDYRFLEKMVERGYEPYLVSYWPRPVQCEVPDARFTHANPRLPCRLGPLGHWARLAVIVLHLRRLLHTFEPDVLHTGYVQTNGFYGALSGFHPTLSMPWGSDILVAPNRSTWERWITRFTLRCADTITCDCELVKNRIVELTSCPAEKIVVFPWGIDLATFNPMPQSGAKIREKLGWQNNQVLIMTRKFTSRIYGIEYFLEAMPTIIQRRPQARAILVGSGPLELEYRALVEELGLSDFVHFAGWLGEPDLCAYLNAADIYVTTSLSDGTSASMLEAMACGLPVVVSDAPAYYEWVVDGENGYIVPRKDAEMLAETLISLLRNESLRKRMGELNEQITQERADWEKNFDILEEIYRFLRNRGVTP